MLIMKTTRITDRVTNCIVLSLQTASVVNPFNLSFHQIHIQKITINLVTNRVRNREIFSESLVRFQNNVHEFIDKCIRHNGCTKISCPKVANCYCIACIVYVFCKQQNKYFRISFAYKFVTVDAYIIQSKITITIIDGPTKSGT